MLKTKFDKFKKLVLINVPIQQLTILAFVMHELTNEQFELLITA